jgi:hypothetical protein
MDRQGTAPEYEEQVLKVNVQDYNSVSSLQTIPVNNPPARYDNPNVIPYTSHESNKMPSYQQEPHYGSQDYGGSQEIHKQYQPYPSQQPQQQPNVTNVTYIQPQQPAYVPQPQTTHVTYVQPQPVQRIPYATTTTIISQPVLSLGSSSTRVKCPNCAFEGVTETSREIGVMAWLMVLFLFVLGWFFFIPWLICWIPL